MRGRSARQLKEPAPSRQPEKEEEKGLPNWLKELGFADLGEEEEKEVVEVTEKEEIPRSRTLREEIKSFDESITYPEPSVEVEAPEAEVPSVSEISPVRPEPEVPEPLFERDLRTILAERGTKWKVPPDIDIRKHRFGDKIYDIESLQDLIVLREILGSPRGMNRYRSRTRF